MISRREFLGTSLAAGATLALTPELVRAFQSGGALIQRAIPSSGEKLPVIALGGGWSATMDPATLKEVVKTLTDNGGRVFDTVHGGPPVRQTAGTNATELGVQDKIFWSTGLLVNGAPPPSPGGPRLAPEPAAVRAEVESLTTMLKATEIDLIQVLAHADIPTHLSVAKQMKKEGRVRYIGVTDLALPPNAKLTEPLFAKVESIMRNEPIDFIGVDYSIGDRRIEERILPLALERKIGVLAYFTFDRGRIFKRAGATPLPEWAADFDAKTWAQFFLKYVISHPAVTVARTGTKNPAHMLDNIGGGIGRLPNEATRKRMAALVDSWPS